MRARQENIRMNGWAIECRINAEDPFNDFLPSTGRISHILSPTGPGVRIDTGVYRGFEVSPYYDSLIAKLVVWDTTRLAAILRMRRALEEYRVMGIKTTIPFHQELMNDARFVAGQFDTSFVEEGFTLVEEKLEEHLKLAAIATTLLAHQQNAKPKRTHVFSRSRRASTWKMANRWRI